MLFNAKGLAPSFIYFDSNIMQLVL